MLESPAGALEKALQFALKEVDGVFGDNVYSDVVPSGADDTYCVFFWAGGGELQEVMLNNTQIFVYSVKCVALNHRDAALGHAQIIDALRKKGTQQVAAGISPLDGGDDWEITTVFPDRIISNTEQYSQTEIFYHRGNQFRIRMEANNG